MEKIDLTYKALLKTTVVLAVSSLFGLIFQSWLVVIGIISMQALYATFLLAEMQILHTKSVAMLLLHISKEKINDEDA